jgi:hypothetical protein
LDALEQRAQGRDVPVDVSDRKCGHSVVRPLTYDHSSGPSSSRPVGVLRDSPRIADFQKINTYHVGLVPSCSTS